MLALSENTTVNTLVAHTALAQPATQVQPLQHAHSVVVSPRMFNQLSSGALSAFVLPEKLETPVGSPISFVNEKNRSRVNLLIGESEHATANPGLEAGFKAIALVRPVRPTGSYEQAAHLVPTAPVSMAFSAANLERRNFMLMYGIGSIHGHPLLDGGTVLLRDDKGDKPTRVAVVQKSDMQGIAPGYMLVTPPQQQPLLSAVRPSW